MFTSCVLVLILGAQDFGTDWIDRVTAESKAPAITASAGVVGFFDSNVFLSTNRERADLVFIPFLEGRFGYEEATLDLSADLLLDYRYYLQETRARNGDQRLFLRARSTQARCSFEIAEVLRHESEPVSIVFLDRVERLVSDTRLRASVDLTEVLAVEAGADLEIVRFIDTPFGALQDNFNSRVSGALVMRMAREMDLLAQVGYLGIAYRTDAGPPDAQGTFVRAGFRGELTPLLKLEAWAGTTTAESDIKSATTADLAFHLGYEATQLWKFTLDYTRRFGFAGGTDPFEVVSSVIASAEFAATPLFSLRGRLQVDQTFMARGGDRDYASASVSGTYTASDHVVFDGGMTSRWGGLGSGGTFDDAILHVGIAFTY